jgi:hypothetical protein
MILASFCQNDHKFTISEIVLVFQACAAPSGERLLRESMLPLLPADKPLRTAGLVEASPGDAVDTALGDAATTSWPPWRVDTPSYNTLMERKCALI